MTEASIPNDLRNEPAFPSQPLDGSGNPACAPNIGLSKRELFAALSTQPGVSEIVTAAGLHCPDNFTVWKDAETKIGTFSDWWAKMSNEERFALSSKVRVQQADALLAALENVDGR